MTLEARLRRLGRKKGKGITPARGARKKYPVKLTIIILALLGAFILVALKLQPLVVGMAEAEVKNAVTLAINEAITEKMSSGEYGYESLIRLEKDSAGAVTAIVANMMTINRLKSELTETITKKVRDTKTSEIYVPLGNIMGGSLLSGRGPRIKLRIISVSSTKASFINSFTASGINQTRNQIFVEPTVVVNVLAPGALTSVEVKTQLVIAECVVVGKVPESYTYFESGSEGEGSYNWDTNVEKYDIIT